MNVDTQTTLRLTRIINGKPDDVFRAWTDPELISRWSAPEGHTVDESTTDLVVGGSYRLVMASAEGVRHTAFGTYREIIPGRKLVYTWDWEEEDSRMGETIVTVLFNRLGETTEVILTHELFPTGDVRDEHEFGWNSCLNRLESLN